MERCGTVLLHTDVWCLDDGIALRGVAAVVDVAVPSAVEEEMARGVGLVVTDIAGALVHDGLQARRWLDGGTGVRLSIASRQMG